MKTVQTVTGPIPVSQLGRTLAHEHIIVMNEEFRTNYPAPFGHGSWDEEKGVADAVAKLKELKETGFDTVVDLTVMPMGRNLERIARISRESNVNVIAATGVYAFEKLPPGPASLALKDGNGGDPLAAMFVRDIVEGDPNGFRASIIKCATDAPGITEGAERILRAVAQAHRRSGAPISTHTHVASKGGLDQQRIFREEGVDLSRVVIGHSGDSTDLDYLESLVGAGSFIGMDRFGIDERLSFDQRVGVVADMCARGYADHMVLSHDASTFNDWYGPEIARSRPNHHFLHIPQDVLPALRARGVTGEQIDAMLIDNPRRLFENIAPY